MPASVAAQPARTLRHGGSRGANDRDGQLGQLGRRTGLQRVADRGRFDERPGRDDLLLRYAAGDCHGGVCRKYLAS